jgi:phytol kinase
MNNDLFNCIWLSGCFLGLFGLAELLYHKFKIQAEYTRKLVHIGTGLLTLLFPILSNHWYVLLLCSSFGLILILSLKFNLLKSINAIDRKSHGSISYPVAVYGTFLFYSFLSRKNDPQLALYYIPILILAICDPVAALCGKRWPWGKYKSGNSSKTMTGSILFAITATGIALLLLLLLSKTAFSSAFIIALILGILTSFTEALSVNGLDNITIPGIAILILWMIIEYTSLYKFQSHIICIYYP